MLRTIWAAFFALVSTIIFSTATIILVTVRAPAPLVERVIEERIDRYALPADLFVLMRELLIQKRASQSDRRSIMAIDDCLELLWRQQLRREHGVRRPLVPAEFTAETGRTAWTEARVIHNRSRTRRKAAESGE